jgi:hypothetical protein
MQPCTKFIADRVTVAPQHSDAPSLRLLAWAALKSQRGQTVVQHRIIAMQRAAQ